MKIELERVLPAEIEARSFEIIESELPHPLPAELAPIIKRVIHTTADFDYADNLVFRADAVAAAAEAFRSGARIVTDTNMALAGINKPTLKKLGCTAQCFMADPEIAAAAKAAGTTRATASIEKASTLTDRPLIFAIGNAPTALVRICEKIAEGTLSPALVIGVPVGFVNVVQSKELLLQTDVPYIVACGRKGGSNVAASIVNALMYLSVRVHG